MSACSIPCTSWYRLKGFVFLMAVILFQNILFGVHAAGSRGMLRRPRLDGAANNFKFKAVNLGGWLVTEGWIKPTLFDGIVNKDLLDGTQVQLRSPAWGKYVCAENGGGSILVANRSNPSGWETFKFWRVAEDKFQFRVFGGQFIGLKAQDQGPNEALITLSVQPGEQETFQVFRKADDPNRVHIKASNGMFLQSKTPDMVTADFSGEPGWEDSNKAVFVMNLFGSLRGEFQVTNGYGPDRAPQVMQDHWNTFIVEDDFRFIANSGLNAVRIPVGWWTASDPNPPAPFVAGSLQILDKAFAWATKYRLKVILDLHAAQYSQNGWEHSASRDANVEFGSKESIAKNVAIIDFFAKRYANVPSLGAVELLNEPRAPWVSLEALSEYYRAGYDAVRRYTSTAFVIMSNRLGNDAPMELFSLTSGLSRVAIDVHYYNLFVDTFNGMTVQQNIDYIYQNRSALLNSLTTANNAPLTFVGEWVAEWQVQGASKEDYQRFAKAQLDVYGRASLGWAYWTLKNVNQKWSMQWMIQNGYINLL